MVKVISHTCYCIKCLSYMSYEPEDVIVGKDDFGNTINTLVCPNCGNDFRVPVIKKEGGNTYEE